MKFTLEKTRGIHIHGFQTGELTLKLPNTDINQAHLLMTYHSSLIITNTDTVEDWAMTQVSELELQHFELAWQTRPEIVLFGSGQKLMFPSYEIRQAFVTKGIGFEAMDTAAACRTYNVLKAEGRDVMALLIID